jgi:hypothetical protein
LSPLSMFPGAERKEAITENPSCAGLDVHKKSVEGDANIKLASVASNLLGVSGPGDAESLNRG